jgi:2-octaprenyl-6-methoxyphenol hydroxylase
MNDDLDVLIVGGGLVGASLAIALDGSGLRVALIEAVAARVGESGRSALPSPDDRNLALSRASVNALTAIGVWELVARHTTPIRRVHVSRQGEFGVARFDAAKHGVDAFGATLPARELGQGLLARLATCTDLLRLAPAKLTALSNAPDAIVADVDTADGNRRLRTQLLVGADGTGSFVRDSLGIQSSHVDYAQTAFVTTVLPERAMDGCAYERFTSTGPVALLPLAERRAGVVLTVPTADAAPIAALDDSGYLALLHERFGYRLGRFSRPGRRVCYPLQRVMAQSLTAARAVLVGNAAQTLHPIAAQGFNLGLRDALTLAEMLVERTQQGADPGGAALLHDYAQRREDDRNGTAALSDGLARWTSSEALPLKLLRSIGLVALDRIGLLQDAFVRRGMGFRGRVPRLALGESR